MAHSEIHVERPRQFFCVRDGLALEDYTCFELTLLLRKSEWCWRPWIAPNKRRKADPVPIDYRAGGAKLYYSTFFPGANYLRALYCSEDL